MFDKRANVRQTNNNGDCRAGSDQRATGHGEGAVLGVVVNPVAGMGGAVGLRGTDGAGLAEARARGAVPLAGARAERAMRRLARALPELQVVAASGDMGAATARSCGWHVEEISSGRDGSTGPDDTRRAALRMRERGVRLLLFAGGDGTARDVLASVGTDVPVLGVPTGVKMHSGVFATTPEAAGDVAARYLSADGLPVHEVEVVDVDEQERRADRISTRLYGVARVPFLRERLQRSKAGPPRQDEAALEGACRAVAAEMEPGRLYVLGPGTTTRRVLAALGLEGSLLGVDAVRDGALIGRDLTERELLALLADGAAATVVLGVIGGQGFLLGRGNQQISRAVLQRARGDVLVVAAAEKLAMLDPPVLHVDLDGDDGDDGAAGLLGGYRRVRTGAHTSTVLRVVG